MHGAQVVDQNTSKTTRPRYALRLKGAALDVDTVDVGTQRTFELAFELVVQLHQRATCLFDPPRDIGIVLGNAFEPAFGFALECHRVLLAEFLHAVSSQSRVPFAEVFGSRDLPAIDLVGKAGQEEPAVIGRERPHLSVTGRLLDSIEQEIDVAMVAGLHAEQREQVKSAGVRWVRGVFLGQPLEQSLEPRERGRRVLVHQPVETVATQ